LKSDEYYKKLQKKVFKSIFTQLDSDADGQISEEKCNTNVLDLDLLRVLEPIMTEIEDDGKTYTCSKFIKR